MLGRSAGDGRFDPSLSELAAVGLGVVAAVSDKLVGLVAWSADQACDRGDAVDQRDQLGDVVAVTTGEREGKRDAALVDD